ncbi:MAG: LON peptidase substrate-binding domain-containing protein [Pseudomonadota bacterium]
MSGTSEMPLFPLGTVLFPGGPLPLRIFEARYLDMVSDCLRNDRVFGVCLIKDGVEVGKPAEPYSIGTTARITDWDRTDDGLLAITAFGESRFSVLSTRIQPDGLLVGECEPLPHGDVALPEEHTPLAKLVIDLLERAPQLYSTIDRHPADAHWVSCRLAELMPLPMSVKQQFLEIDDPVERLEQMVGILRQLQNQANDSEA